MVRKRLFLGLLFIGVIIGGFLLWNTSKTSTTGYDFSFTSKESFQKINEAANWNIFNDVQSNILSSYENKTQTSSPTSVNESVTNDSTSAGSETNTSEVFTNTSSSNEGGSETSSNDTVVNDSSVGDDGFNDTVVNDSAVNGTGVITVNNTLVNETSETVNVDEGGNDNVDSSQETSDESTQDTGPSSESQYPISELGNCSSRSDCEYYCSEHLNECLEFAESNDLINEEDLEKLEELSTYINNTQTPGNCSSIAECNAYCSNSSNLEECVSFNADTGLMSDESANMSMRNNGTGPGNCSSPEECDAYCQQEEHFEECITYAEENGLISAEEAEMARATGGTGPGGCTSESECEEYCETHDAECINFGLEHGIISVDDLPQSMSEEDKCMFTCIVENDVGFENCMEGNEENQSEGCKQCSIECGLSTESEETSNLNEYEQCLSDCFTENSVNPETCGQGDSSTWSENCQSCISECESLNTEEESNSQNLTEDEQCMYNCILENGLDPEVCGVGDPSAWSEDCTSCAEDCELLSSQSESTGSETTNLTQFEQCLSECIINNNLDFETCGQGDPNTWNEACKSCVQSCEELIE